MNLEPGPMTLGEIASMACRELPEGWELVVSLKNGCDVVMLYDPRGDSHDDAFSIDEDIETQVKQAIGFAKSWPEE